MEGTPCRVLLLENVKIEEKKSAAIVGIEKKRSLQIAFALARVEYVGWTHVENESKADHQGNQRAYSYRLAIGNIMCEISINWMCALILFMVKSVVILL